MKVLAIFVLLALCLILSGCFFYPTGIKSEHGWRVIQKWEEYRSPIRKVTILNPSTHDTKTVEVDSTEYYDLFENQVIN